MDAWGLWDSIHAESISLAMIVVSTVDVLLKKGRDEIYAGSFDFIQKGPQEFTQVRGGIDSLFKGPTVLQRIQRIK